MVKNGYINIYGVYTDDYVEGDALPCPVCGKEGTAEVIRSLEFEPPGMRLGCCECGYKVPDRLIVYGYEFDDSFEKALKYWNEQSRLIQESAAQEFFDPFDSKD